MTRIQMSKKELLLAVVPGLEGEPVVRYAVVNGRRILDADDQFPTNFSGPVRAAIYSPESYFENIELVAASDKMLPLVARRHIDTELVFDASYRLRTVAGAKRERTIATDIAALPDHDLDNASALLPMEKNPCLVLVPVELAVAGLVNKVYPNSAMVFWEKAGVMLALLVEGGMVQARMREQVRDDNRDAFIGRAELNFRNSLLRLGDTRESPPTVYMGDLVDIKQASEEKAAQALTKKLYGLYRAGSKVSKDSVLRDPELYGLPFVAEGWSFVDAFYRDKVRAWRYARPVAAFAAAAGLAFALVGGFQHLQALLKASDFDDQRLALQQTIAEINEIKPSDEAMERVRQGLQIQRQSLNEVRLDRMLGWLSHLVPEQVVIRSLEVTPPPVPRQTKGLRAVNYLPGEKPFSVKMEIMLAETTLDAAEASAAEVVRRLSQRLQMVDTRLEVPAPEPGVRRNVVLVVDSVAKAVSF